MPKCTFTVNKLEMIDPQFVSLVERGANRLPFKVIKSDSEGSSMKNGMMGIDLARVFARKGDTPAIVGVVIRKSGDVDAIKAAVESAGFTVGDAIDNDDGTLVFKQEGADSSLGNPVVLRLNDEVALVAKGFRPYEMDVSTGNATFAETCAAQGFYPGLYQFSETLTSSIRELLYAAETQPEAAKAVAKLMGEATNYITSLINQLPAKAFKLEGATAVLKADKKAKKPVEPTADKDAVQPCDDPNKEAPAKEAPAKAAPAKAATTEEQEPSGKDKDKAKTPVKGKKSDEADQPEAAMETAAVVEAQAADPVVEEAPAADPAPVATPAFKSDDLVAALSVALSSALAPVVEAVKKQETTLTDVINQIGDRVRKTEEALGQVSTDVDNRLSTVVPCHVTAGDPEPIQASQKSESRGEIDTAMLGRRQRNR